MNTVRRSRRQPANPTRHERCWILGDGQQEKLGRPGYPTCRYLAPRAHTHSGVPSIYIYTHSPPARSPGSTASGPGVPGFFLLRPCVLFIAKVKA